MDDNELRRYNVDPNIDPSSRYNNSDRIIYDDGTEIQETYNREVIKRSIRDKYHKVTPGEVGRLDLISFKYYGTPMYWWSIAEASGISDPLSIDEGDELRIPNITTLVSRKGGVIR